MPSNTVSDNGGWEATAQICRDILQESIPQQWTLSPDQIPAKERRNVMKVPYESGNLTVQELDITEKGVAALHDGYRSGIFTVEQVTIAFLKRAVIGHQLVDPPHIYMYIVAND